MEEIAECCELDAKNILCKHQRKVTSHRVDVLLFLMRHRKAFTLRQLTERFLEKIDRATIYRTLNCFIGADLTGKALNKEGHSCFFYTGHLQAYVEGQTYLECIDCDQIFDLPGYPDHYLSALGVYSAQPLSTLLKGHCNRIGCKEHT